MSNGYRERKLFTIEQANATLPLVRAIAKDLSELAHDVVDRRDRLAGLMAGRKASADDMYSAELTQIQDELEKDGQRLQDYVQELVELGVEPKDALQGLVDFPCALDGRVVYLCWRLGEPEVLFWHELDAGFTGRQPLTAGSTSDADPAGRSVDL